MQSKYINIRVLTELAELIITFMEEKTNKNIQKLTKNGSRKWEGSP